MDIGELVSVDFPTHLAKEDRCSKKDPPDEGWQARINEWGSKADCSGTRLYASMKKLFSGARTCGYLSGPAPYIAKSAGPWSLDSIGKLAFPVQAHHLIPKNYLPTHKVCAFLAKKYTKHPKFRLKHDAPYSTDYANNGYCMPYATPLAEWKKSRGNEVMKAEICFEVMRRTGRQLHQGSHRVDEYFPDPADPDEEAKIHPAGYLRVVRRYLDVVHDCAAAHVVRCRICKPDQDSKEILPRKAIAKHMDQVAGIVKLLVDCNRTFISEPAAVWGRERPESVKRPAWMRK